MTVLKTLKDLGVLTISPTTQEEIRVIHSLELKQEAIKWVKHDIKLFGKEMGKMTNYKFINFFNITEEELK